MSKARHFDYYPDEFLVGTRELTDAERGIYWTACTLMYSHGGPIPLGELRRWCSTRRPFQQIIDKLVRLGKLTWDGSNLGQNRVQTEVKRASNRVSKWVQNGSKGGRPSNKSNGIEEPSGSPARVTNQLPTTNHKNIVRAKALTPSPRRRAEDEFAEVYQLYPRHVGRGAALKAFVRARQTVELRVLVDAVQAYAIQRAGEDPQYTPHMSTWLNQQRWADEDAPDPHGGPDHDDAARQAAIEDALRELGEGNSAPREIRETH